jgi:hypothetical protein
MKYIKLLSIGLVLLAVCGYYHRYPTEDNAWFAEESFWLLKVGYVKSAFFSGLLGWGNNYFLSHKFFIDTRITSGCCAKPILSYT